MMGRRGSTGRERAEDVLPPVSVPPGSRRNFCGIARRGSAQADGFPTTWIPPPSPSVKSAFIVDAAPTFGPTLTQIGMNEFPDRSQNDLNP